MIDKKCVLFSLVSKKYRGFTLAEILLSLSIIGIVAAIVLPSLLGNVHERAFETQKKVLYTRFSQSLPLLPNINGFGEIEIEGNDINAPNSGEVFIRDGLSKVMKITNICDKEHLGDCGLPDKIIPMNENGAINLSDIPTIIELKENFDVYRFEEDDVVYSLHVDAAAFETVNGESILAYYNPLCIANESNYIENSLKYKLYIDPKKLMCVNFVYDLNGKKGPNTVGKDIGFITAFFSTDPIVAAPNLLRPIDRIGYTIDEVTAKAKELDARLPNVYEAASLSFNGLLLFGTSEGPFGQGKRVNYPGDTIFTNLKLTGRSFSSLSPLFVKLHYTDVQLMSVNQSSVAAFLKR